MSTAVEPSLSVGFHGQGVLPLRGLWLMIPSSSLIQRVLLGAKSQAGICHRVRDSHDWFSDWGFYGTRKGCSSVINEGNTAVIRR